MKELTTGMNVVVPSSRRDVFRVGNVESVDTAVAARPVLSCDRERFLSLFNSALILLRAGNHALGICWDCYK
jgi:hypothetical protein